MTRGDLTALEQALADDARWRAVEDGPMNCEGRDEILEVMGRNLKAGLRGTIEELIQDGPRILAAFAPESPRQTGRPLEDGIAYVVVTVREDKIEELKGCAGRAEALRYLHGGRSSTGRQTTAPAPTDGPRPPDTQPAPPPHRVNQLVPFVHVEEVERSVAFYRQLGFVVASVYSYRQRPVWAALESDAAKLMVTVDGDPIDPGGQGVLFYLYAPDLAALRAQLLADGIAAGEIRDGSPGPRQEMRVIDPDGYVLMIAQVDS
jgi:ketosteroid isomerase-like protein